METNLTMEEIEDYLSNSKPTANLTAHLERLIFESVSNRVLTTYLLRKQIQIEHILNASPDEEKVSLDFAKVMDFLSLQVEKEYKNVLFDVASKSKH